MARLSHAGAAPPSTITATMGTNTPSQFGIADGTGWPDGSIAPFVVVIDPDTPQEEKLLISSRSGNNLNVQTRGADGTVASEHQPPAQIWHCVSALELEDAQGHIYDRSRNDHTQYVRIGSGLVVPLTLGPGAQTDVTNSTPVNLVAVSWSAVAGRSYRIGAFALGTTTVEGAGWVQMVDPGGRAWRMTSESQIVLPAGVEYGGGTVGLWTASASGAVSAYVQAAFAGTGVLRFAAQAARIWVEEVV